MPQIRKIERPSPSRLLHHIFESPALVAALQSLEPRLLGKLIDHVGLEDCGEILGLATIEQLKDIFDEDLWKSERPGTDETFDADRFALWIEVMLEAGDDFAAAKLAALDEDLVTLLFHRRFLVLELDALRLELEESGAKSALVEKALDSCLYEEIGDYQIIARTHQGWDAMLSLLLALDKESRGLAERILARCCALSATEVEEHGGLYRVLTSEEMLEGDLAAERGQRRAHQGFIAPSAAASFLALCRLTPPDEVIRQPRDAVTRFYFRDRGTLRTTPSRAAAEAPSVAQLEALIASLDEAGPLHAAERHALLAGPVAAGGAGAQGLLERALALLGERDAEAAARRIDELGYLANVLASGCSLGDRAFRPFEAAIAAAATCNLGLERLSKEGDASSVSPEQASHVLAGHGADKAFRIGFWILHHEVAAAACHALERALRRRADAAADFDLRRRLERAAAALHSAASGGKPWQARGELERLEPVFDAPTRESLLSLLGEYPVLFGGLSQGAAARHRLDGGRRPIATADDLRRVRVFLAQL